jgi:DNA-binding TFAR19-related protein (PDSD5 family)
LYGGNGEMRKGEKLYNYLEEEAKEYLASMGKDFFTPYDNDIIYREVVYNLRWKIDDEELEKILE